MGKEITDDWQPAKPLEYYPKDGKKEGESKSSPNRPEQTCREVF